ncbi:MAG TPA: hypothetical protein VE078_05880 [Thermoanaerobaculia bacterium]|nr:hypothetical protein [Thermoanaerobaculia bacterium]
MEKETVIEKRGSEELFKRLNRTTELKAEDLRHLVSSVEGVSGRILSWEIYGKPAFEVLRASFVLKPDRLSAFVDHLVQGKTRFGWEVFPEGVPPLIDQYRVVVKNAGGGL